MTLAKYLQPTPECLPLERFGAALTDAERAHVRTCLRCETELTLWRSYEDVTPTSGNDAAVQWVVAQLQRASTARRAAAAPRRRHWGAIVGWRSALAAASVLLAVGIGVVLRDPEPPLRLPSGDADTYRSATVTVTAPIGDIRRAPTGLSWVSLDGAVRYDVEVFEVDRVALWRATSLTAHIELPRSVIERIVPGKTVQWTVTAIDASGKVLGDSGTQSFRVATIKTGAQ